jgi:D-glycero-D-manno-heptose 1,7-bisphosphate phosphatase
MAGRAAVFLDLGGTLGPTCDFPEFSWYPMATEAVRLVNQMGFLAIALTNQSPIAAGRFSLEAFWHRLRELERELSASGAKLDAVYCCPHRAADGCPCAKPRLGMIDAARRQFAIDLARSYVVGDRGDLDMLLAAAIGAKAVLVRTGQGEGSLREFRHTWATMEAHYVAADVLDAVHWIVRQGRVRAGGDTERRPGATRVAAEP